MNCPHCGSEYKAGWKFCTNCAKPLPDESGNIPDIVAPIAGIKTADKQDSGSLFKFFAGIALIIAIIYFSATFGNWNTTSSNASTSSLPQKKASDVLQIQQGWEWKNEGYGYSKITGSVKNIGTSPITYFEVTAEFKDETGKVLDTSYTNSNETIRPGNEKRFEIMHKNSPDFKKISIHVNRVIN